MTEAPGRAPSLVDLVVGSVLALLGSVIRARDPHSRLEDLRRRPVIEAAEVATGMTKAPSPAHQRR
ncbi:hypothetical protein ACT3TZ_04265 [Brachybacterium sp. AOP25-B2-12]|uniref:hypothetical protein n=1 Tax=Brachybacterium sp. AOP25-B2-12 TaxID=3457710 RepID=UPI004033B548